MLPTFSPRQLAHPALAALLLASTAACKPSAALPPTAGPSQPPPQEVAAPSSPDDARRPPGTEELTRFLRGKFAPAALRVAELKHDPPVPLPGTPPGSNAWLYQVRVTFVPAEDVLGPVAAPVENAFHADLEALRTLATWSEAYAHSPHAARYPGFPVEPPPSHEPKLLVLLYAKDQPLAPLYGKLSAEWQVDHWNYEIVSLQKPADDKPGKLRSEYTGPLLIQGSPEAERYQKLIRDNLDAARAKKAALDAAYQADLRAATAPGTTYQGTLTHGKNVLRTEARFLAAAAGDEPNAVRMEFRLPEAGYTYLCAVRLASSPPVPLAPANDTAEVREELFGNGGKPAPKADLALRYLHITDPKSARPNTPAVDFRQAAIGFAADPQFWLSIEHGHLTGKMTPYDFHPPYFFDGQAVP